MSEESRKLSFVEEDDVETQVFNWGRLAWLSEPLVIAAARFSAGVVTVDPGQGHDLHNHPGREEIIYVLSGKGMQVVEPESGRVEREVGPGVLVHIPPGVYHSTVNTGNDTMRVLVVYSPPGPEAEFRKMDGVTIEPPKR